MRPIVMHFGDVAISAQLNDSAAAHALFTRLPMVIPMSASSVGICGAAPLELPVDFARIHRGWTNGDVNYNPASGWLAVFFDDEENSQRYDDQFTIGHIEGSLTQLRALAGSYDVVIEAGR